MQQQTATPHRLPLLNRAAAPPAAAPPRARRGVRGWVLAAGAFGFFLLGAASVIFGGAVALGAFDHHHPAPPAGGANGTNGSSVVVGCQSRADVRVFIDHSSDFGNSQASCGRQSLGQAGPTAKCLEKQWPSMNTECLACYGDKVECGRDKCLKECFSGPSAECTACTCAKCVPALVACVRLPTFLTPDSDCPVAPT